jgi:hypothetical protein
MQVISKRVFLGRIIPIIALATISSLTLLETTQATLVKPLISKEYLGRATELEYLPTTILYDPYGKGSYQKIETTSTVSVSNIFKAVGAGIVASGSAQVSITYSTSYSSSQSTNPAQMGPGKGDAIIGKLYNMTWDVWFVSNPITHREYYEYKLVSYTCPGTFIKSRTGLAAVSDTYVEDKTGQVGTYRYLWDIDPGYEVGKSFEYSWSGSITVGYEFKVNILGILNSELSYTVTVSGTQTYSTHSRYYDNDNRLFFYENAGNANPTLSTIFSYAFWYGLA